jgi:hypothetical protein
LLRCWQKRRENRVFASPKKPMGLQMHRGIEAARVSMRNTRAHQAAFAGTTVGLARFGG